MRSCPAWVPLFLILVCTACRPPEPRAELDLTEIETYWVVDSSVGATQYIAPAIRFRIRNKGQKAWSGIQATATFRRKGEEERTWGSDWQPVTAPGKALAPNDSVLVVMRSDGRYYSSGPPESFFRHELFKDAKVEVFLRIGASAWTKLAETEVERRIGSKSLAAPKP